MTIHFSSIEEMLFTTAEAVRPPERLTVSEAAEKYRYLRNEGAYIGPWKNEKVPYMVEPMDVLTSTEYTGMIYCGPAQSAKTDSLILNWITHSAKCDPADMMVILPSKSAARDFSMRRMDRLFRHSPEVGLMLMSGQQNQNTFDMRFLSGWLLTLSWPTINELSGKPIPRLILTDYDRMDEDIGGEGDPYSLAAKRATTFKRYGMTAAESSPSYEVENPRWLKKTPHEAPPTRGILAKYNQGDRRRYYWRCPNPKCRLAFEPDFDLLSYPNSKDHLEAAEMATMDCPHCSFSMTHEAGPGQAGKSELNCLGKWIKDGMLWLPDGTVAGTPFRSQIASFWQKGVTASFMDWKSMVFKYLKAIEEYEATGSYQAWKSTVNTDQAHPFVSPSMQGNRLPEDLKSRALDIGEKVVPEGVRFLISTVDVQGGANAGAFIVQVHGFGEGGDVTIIDRFSIRKSTRLDEDGERYLLSPASYVEDWKLLIPEVIEKTYPLADGSGRHMAIKAVGNDLGGTDGVTAKAYDFWRWLRDHHPGDHHRRYQLIKGDPLVSSPRARITYPDTDRKDRRALARGEVPVLMLNSNLLKDQISAMLGRTIPAGGMVNFPNWLQDSFYTELTVESRTQKGWENPKRLRNESWDLLYYAVGVSISRHARIEQIDWNSPPDWAKPWNSNSLVFLPETSKPFVPEKKPFDLSALSKLAEDLA
jgi:phage terminase large subunit GpA-like protein